MSNKKPYENPENNSLPYLVYLPDDTSTARECTGDARITIHHESLPTVGLSFSVADAYHMLRHEAEKLGYIQSTN